MALDMIIRLARVFMNLSARPQGKCPVAEYREKFYLVARLP
jgi:hypothetical protein